MAGVPIPTGQGSVRPRRLDQASRGCSFPDLYGPDVGGFMTLTLTSITFTVWTGFPPCAGSPIHVEGCSAPDSASSRPGTLLCLVRLSLHYGAHCPVSPPANQPDNGEAYHHSQTGRAGRCPELLLWPAQPDNEMPSARYLEWCSCLTGQPDNAELCCCSIARCYRTMAGLLLQWFTLDRWFACLLLLAGSPDSTRPLPGPPDNADLLVWSPAQRHTGFGVLPRPFWTLGSVSLDWATSPFICRSGERSLEASYDVERQLGPLSPDSRETRWAHYFVRSTTYHYVVKRSRALEPRSGAVLVSCQYIRNSPHI